MTVVATRWRSQGPPPAEDDTGQLELVWKPTEEIEVPEDLVDAWDRALRDLRRVFGPADTEIWLEPCGVRVVDDTVYVVAPDEYTARVINETCAVDPGFDVAICTAFAARVVEVIHVAGEMVRR